MKQDEKEVEELTESVPGRDENTDEGSPVGGKIEEKILRRRKTGHPDL